MELERLEINGHSVVYDDKKHLYTVDGVQWDSVSRIIRSQFEKDACPKCGYAEGLARIPDNVLKSYQKFGTAAHRATELCDKGILDYDTVDPQIMPYLNGWIKFKNDYRVEIISIEEILIADDYRYTGRLDRAAGVNEELAIVDMKTGKIRHTAALQTAPYMHAYNRMHPDMKAVARYAVQLLPDDYVVQKFTEYRRDFQVFASCLTLMNYRKNTKGVE